MMRPGAMFAAMPSCAREGWAHDAVPRPNRPRPHRVRGRKNWRSRKRKGHSVQAGHRCVPRSRCVAHVSGEADCLLEVVVRRFLVGKLLELAVIREVRSNIAIQTLKAGASLLLDHLDAA